MHWKLTNVNTYHAGKDVSPNIILDEDNSLDTMYNVSTYYLTVIAIVFINIKQSSILDPFRNYIGVVLCELKYIMMLSVI